MNALGIDVSRYNSLVNWEIAARNGVTFAGIRAGISYAYRDPFAAINFAGAREVGIRRLAYHVLYPAESAAKQADNYFAITAGQDVWPVPDLELAHDQTATRITDTALEWCRLVERETGKRPVMYSRADRVNNHMTAGAWRDSYNWWLAHYLSYPAEKPSPPALPVGVTKWLVHQNADKILAWPGLQSGGIVSCDINRWNGTDADMRAWFGGTTVPTIAERLDALEAWAQTCGYIPIGG